MDLAGIGRNVDGTAIFAEPGVAPLAARIIGSWSGTGLLAGIGRVHAGFEPV